jgi:hypothetical protein
MSGFPDKSTAVLVSVAPFPELLKNLYEVFDVPEETDADEDDDEVEFVDKRDDEDFDDAKLEGVALVLSL